MSSLYSLQQPPFIPVGFGKSQEYVGKNKGLEEGEIEKFGEGNVLLHSVFICHTTVSPLCLYINFSHLSWKELSSLSPILRSHYFTPVKGTFILLKTQ